MSENPTTEEAMSWVVLEGWAPTCAFKTYPGSQRWMEPEEYCENEPLDGDEFCEYHLDAKGGEPTDDDEPHGGSFDECYEASWETA